MNGNACGSYSWEALLWLFLFLPWLEVEEGELGQGVEEQCGPRAGETQQCYLFWASGAAGTQRAWPPFWIPDPSPEATSRPKSIQLLPWAWREVLLQHLSLQAHLLSISFGVARRKENSSTPDTDKPNRSPSRGKEENFYALERLTLNRWGNTLHICIKSVFAILAAVSSEWLFTNCKWNKYYLKSDQNIHVSKYKTGSRLWTNVNSRSAHIKDLLLMSTYPSTHSEWTTQDALLWAVSVFKGLSEAWLKSFMFSGSCHRWGRSRVTYFSLPGGQPDFFGLPPWRVRSAFKSFLFAIGFQ